jgi:hypothetical protein
MRRRGLALLLALAATLALGTAGARAEGIVPAEGEWSGITTAGKTLGFTVREGRITGLHFGFNAAGLCGSGEAIEDDGATPELSPLPSRSGSAVPTITRCGRDT